MFGSSIGYGRLGATELRGIRNVTLGRTPILPHASVLSSSSYLTLSKVERTSITQSQRTLRDPMNGNTNLTALNTVVNDPQDVM